MALNPISDRDIQQTGPMLQRMMWAERAVKEKIQQFGALVLPINFYSNTPSLEDIETSFEYANPLPPYADERLFNAQNMVQTLEQLLPYSPEFCPLADGDEDEARTFFWKNSQFSFSDAMAYYCFVRKLCPKTVLEIGSGFSTLIAVEAVRKNEHGNVICMEPYPRPFLEKLHSVTLKKAKAQEISSEWLNDTLQDGDILFIDSTHTVKTGSDCLHIYLRLMPNIRRNIFVHVHDVFLPFGLPKEWLVDRQIFWTEQYLLLALLTDNVKARILYGSAYHHAFNHEMLKRFMGDKWGSGGGSFWFEYRGRMDAAPN